MWEYGLNLALCWLYDIQEIRADKEPKADFVKRTQDIKHPLIEKIFNVKVSSIRTINVKPKKRRVGRYTGLTNRTKKAIVTLAEGQTIELG